MSSEDAKYIDLNQIASIQMVDGTTIMINNGQKNQEKFVEENQMKNNMKLKKSKIKTDKN
jgi:hypothetical protein